MATPLDFNLDGLTAEQLRAARQFQQRLGGARAARVAGPAATPGPAPEMVNTTAQSAARATAGPATGSTPTATNPAPVETSRAASSASFGKRLLGFLGRAAGGVQAAFGVNDLVQGRVGAGAENVALGAATAVNPLVGIAGNALATGRDFIMEKVIDRLYGQNQTFLPQPTRPAATGGAAAARPTPVDAEALINGTAVPERGTGAFRRGRAPAVAVDTRGRGAEAPAAVATPAPAQSFAPVAVPQLSTQGNIFEAAAGLGSGILNTAAQVGAQRRGAKAAAATTANTVKATELGIKAEEAVSGRITALATADKSKTGDVAVTTDFQGNPIIVDKRTRTAEKPTVTAPPSRADITATATKHGLTEAQVVQRLVAEGRLNPNSAIALRYAVQ